MDSIDSSNNMCASSAAARLHFANTLAILSKADVSEQLNFITEGAALSASKEEMNLRETEAEMVAALAMEETNRLNLTRAEIARDAALTSATQVTESEARRVARVEMISKYNNAALEDENAANAMDQSLAELLRKVTAAKEKASTATSSNENLLPPAAAAVVTEGIKAKAATTYYNGLREVLAAAVL
jgi:hypothetical protein